MKKCSVCGTEAADNATYCDYCDNRFETSNEIDPIPKPGKRENVMAGLVGAVIGAVIGGASIVLVSRLGFVASICGVILAVCTLKGYELMAGSMGKTGIVICVALMLVTPYIADRLDWAIVLMEYYKESFGETLSLGMAFSMIPELLAEDVIEMSTYVSTLVKLYLFTALGAVGSIVSAVKKK